MSGDFATLLVAQAVGEVWILCGLKRLLRDFTFFIYLSWLLFFFFIIIIVVV